MPTKAPEKAIALALDYILAMQPMKGKELPSIDLERNKNVGIVSIKPNSERHHCLMTKEQEA